MKKKGKKKFVVILIFCLFLAAAFLFIGFGVPKSMKQTYTEEKTNEYMAVFKSKEKQGEYYIIYLNNNNSLMVESAAVINIERLNSLTNGEKITFRSVYKFDPSIQKEYPIGIVSLKTEDSEIVTLESSRAAVTEGDIKITITSVVVSSLLLIGAVVCILYIVGVLPKKQKTKSE